MCSTPAPSRRETAPASGAGTVPLGWVASRMQLPGTSVPGLFSTDISGEGRAGNGAQLDVPGSPRCCPQQPAGEFDRVRVTRPAPAALSGGCR